METSPQPRVVLGLDQEGGRRVGTDGDVGAKAQIYVGGMRKRASQPELIFCVSPE